MKRVLILVLSCEDAPYGDMVTTSRYTWDSINVEGVQTLFYFGISPYQRADNTCVYLPIKESLATMGEKTIQGLEYALNNYEFDYIARVNSSCYVDKKRLFDYVQTLQDNNLFEGLLVKREKDFDYVWGGGQFIISEDVARKVVDNRTKWNHNFMEDESLGLLVSQLGIPFTNGSACSINKRETDWLLLSYGNGQSIEFNDFKDIKDSPHYFYRVKCDGERDVDKYVMQQLFKNNEIDT
jgi:hypothetical protein